MANAPGSPVERSQTDVLVVGSGAAGLTAAITARLLGLDVVVVEKTPYYGGSTAYSGGGTWIPNNHHLTRNGFTDSPETIRTYMRNVLGNHYDPGLVEPFLQNGPEMLAFMEERTQVRFKPFPVPDYESETEGATRGRTMIPEVYDGRLLGPQLASLRKPLPQLTLFGSMQLEGADIHPMRNALRTAKGFGHATRLMARFAAQKARSGRGTRLTAGNALVGRLLRSALDAGVQLCNNTAAVRVLAEHGAVQGVVVRHGDVERTIHARCGVLLASGGFAASRDMRTRLIPFAEHHWSMHPDGNAGDGIAMGVGAGGVLNGNNVGNAILAPVSVWKRRDGTVVTYPHIFIDRSMPGCIAVDPSGRRFVNEGGSYHAFVEAMHRNGFTVAYLIANRRFLRSYGMGLARPFPFSEKPYLRDGYLLEAPTLAALAGRIGADPPVLEGTVHDFDEHARRGKDPLFHRGEDAHSRFRGDQSHAPNPTVGPVGEGPYYALAVHPGDLGSMTGLTTDGSARVLDTEGRVIEGLYAAGLDMNSIVAGTYPSSGSGIGTGMTFGYIAAKHMAARSARPAPAEAAAVTA